MSSHVHNVTHHYGRVCNDYNLGVRQLAKWHETRKTRELARREQERLEVLEWAKETAARRIKEEGIDETKFYKDLTEEISQREIDQIKKNQYNEARRKKRRESKK